MRQLSPLVQSYAFIVLGPTNMSIPQDAKQSAGTPLTHCSETYIDLKTHLHALQITMHSFAFYYCRISFDIPVNVIETLIYPLWKFIDCIPIDVDALKEL